MDTNKPAMKPPETDAQKAAEEAKRHASEDTTRKPDINQPGNTVKADEEAKTRK